MSYTSGPFALHAQQVLLEDRASRPNNTRLSYNNRVKEFIQFCEAKYSSESPAQSASTVTEEKLFGFLHYQSRRPLCPRRKKSSYCKRKVGRRSNADEGMDEDLNLEDDDGIFNEAEYDFYMQPENINFCARKPVGYSVINHYMCAILDLHQQQIDNGCNNITKEQLRSNRIRKLLANVKVRKTTIARENFEERLTGEFSPYTSVNEIPRLEQGLFDRSKNSLLRSLPSLRDRYALLQTISGILRGESMIKADLSDLCDLMHNHSSRTAYPIHIVVMRIAQGKVNANKVLYGRSIRHRDVNLCAIGSLALYLFARLKHTQELDDVDFTCNSSWFNIKLLTDCSCQNNCRAISERSYYKSIKKMCEQLSIPSKHYIHFGRTSGSVVAELEELDGSNIQDLGNWNVDTRREVYSAKLPMKAMRVMAGHNEQKGSVFIARSLLIPPESLQLQIFPFIEEALEQIKHTPRGCSTAYCFLQLLTRLRVVLLQDVAEMIIHGRTHVVFQCSVFQTEEFKRYTEDMSQHLLHVQNPEDQSLQSLLPGINERFNNLHADFSAKFMYVQNKFDDASNKFTTQLQHVLQQIGTIDVTGIDETNSAGGEIEISAEPFRYSLFKGHTSYRTIYHEWYGTNEFDYNNNSRCYKGGIVELEKEYGLQWRSHFTPAEQKYFSRLKLIVLNINKCIEQHSTTAEEVLIQLENLCKEHSARTVTALEKLLRNYLSTI